jgi:nuclear GTP-binding protein
MNLLTTETFEETFNGKRIRKRPRLQGATDLASLVTRAESTSESYDTEADKNMVTNKTVHFRDGYQEKVFEKGQSRRLWQELYKVIDSSDVVLQVLDARDPMGTRSRRIENEMGSKERRHKHLVFVLNKCDLVPTWVTRRWVKLLSEEYPTLAFHASITNPFGKGALIQLLRQFGVLHKDKKQISVGVVGYPNVGKSSVINTLRAKKVCKAAPIPGETKVITRVCLLCSPCMFVRLKHRRFRDSSLPVPSRSGNTSLSFVASF